MLLLLLAPVANAWCATVCMAAAISSGCGHGLQPTDDLPMEKASPAAVPQGVTILAAGFANEAAPVERVTPMEPRAPLRL
jgi:hypothetical protein